MLNIPEFSKGMNVTYWNGKKFYNAHIQNLILNPIDNVVEYTVYFRENNTAAGFFKGKARPHQIKESKHFTGGPK